MNPRRSLGVAWLVAALAAGCGDDGDGGATGSGGGAGGSATGGSGAGGSGVWTPPIGIPAPEFGVHETVDTTCAGCEVLSATESSALEDIAPGTVVELASEFCATGTLTISGVGTAEAPIFVRGPSRDAPVRICQPTAIVGSYLIVENIDFDFGGSTEGGVGLQGDHLALRFSQAHDYQPGHNSTVLHLADSEHVVLYGNLVHDNGDFAVDCTAEQDVHGIGGTAVHRVWIVDSELYANRGDSVQFGHQAGNTLGDIYIGRNDLSGDGENCVDVKEASRVVISQNRLHATHCGMATVVLHDCPLDAAAIYNEVFDESVGINTASLEPVCAPEQPINLFMIGNDLHDLDVGIEGWGSGKHYYVAGNTFTNVATETDISEADLLDEDLQTALDAFLAVYGIDISQAP